MFSPLPSLFRMFRTFLSSARQRINHLFPLSRIWLLYAITVLGPILAPTFIPRLDHPDSTYGSALIIYLFTFTLLLAFLSRLRHLDITASLLELRSLQQELIVANNSHARLVAQRAGLSSCSPEAQVAFILSGTNLPCGPTAQGKRTSA